MSIDQLFLERTQLYRTGPILYRGDPDIAAQVSRELQSFSSQGIPDVLIRATVDTFIQLQEPLNTELHDEYLRAYRRVSSAINKSEELKRYRLHPSKSALEALINQYIEEAPRTTILRMANLTNYHELAFSDMLGPLGSDEHRELALVVSRLTQIEIDEPDIGLAVKKVQQVLDNIDNLIVAWIALIGFTPEGFTFRLHDQPPYEFDRSLTSWVFTGLKHYMPFNPKDSGYMVWWSQLMAYASNATPRYLPILSAAFPSPAAEVFNGYVPDELKDVVEITGEAFAALCTVFKTEAAQQLILPRLAHMFLTALTPEQQPLDMPFRKWAWGMLPGLSKATRGVFESVAKWIYTTKKLALQWAAPVTILSPVIGLTYTIATSLYELIDKLIDVLVYGLDKFAHPMILWMKEYLYLGRAWASVVLPGARRRPKAVWALLFVNDFTRLDPGTRFALSCEVMTNTPSPSFQEWETRFQKDINATGLADFPLFPHPPLRPLRLPNNPITIDEEILALAPLFPGQSRETDIMDEKLAQWVQYNVPQGIDGQWFATPERVAQSIIRYDIDRNEPDAETTNLLRRTAHALADQFPEMYKAHQYFTPGHAMRRLKWDTNMSPGLGFMGNVRTRKMLRRHGFLAAIQEVATRRLQEGIHPGTVAHAFVKEQVVSLEKLLQGKNIRTVIAMALMSNVMALPWSIELTRAPPPEAFVLNALPRSEGGYRPVFEALRQHPLVLQADASEFDSKLGPVLTVEGLGELRSIGFESNPALPIIRSQIFEHYYHMRHANIVDLTTGRVFNKTGGLMTGQVNTSYDNRDAFRLMIIAAISHVSGIPPDQFWVHNTLGNAGDDDVIGSNLSRELWIKAFQYCKDVFGVTVNLEQEGWDNLSITALQPTPEMRDTAYYRAELGMPVVDYGIRTEPAKLLMSKTEFRARHSRLSDIPFRQAHIDSMIGTAYLSAYNPEIYHDLADLYVADMRYILLRFYKSVQVTEQRDKFGNLAFIDVQGFGIRERYKHVAPKIDNMIKSWQKKVKFPSYQRVFNIWVRPYTVERSSIAKHHRTLLAQGPVLPMSMKLLYNLVGFREQLYQIPNHVVRALPEFQGADISATLKTPEFMVERFVWLSLFHKMKAIPTKTAFMNALREGPYATAASPVDFLEHIEMPGYLEELINSDLEASRAQVIVMTLMYVFIEKILEFFAHTPLLGLVINLYALATRDVNRLYATSNIIYWTAEGRSSSIISNLQPNDPYKWVKWLAIILTTGVPVRWIAVPGLHHLVDWMPALVESWVLAAATVAPNVGRMTFQDPPMNSPWAYVIDTLLAKASEGANFSATIVAPTGSGKSTLALALIAHAFPKRKIWLLHPTKVARDEYQNNFVSDGLVQILHRGVERRIDALIYSVTYGYFIQIWSQVLDTDIIVLDEVHMAATEMWVAWWLSTGMLRFCMTATPKYELQPQTTINVTYPGTRRFKMTMTYVNQTFEQLWTTLSNTRPALITRALIICPTLQKVNYIRNTLTRMSVASSELSSDFPIPAKSGIIVATSIADQALTIEPPPTTVIDLGEMLVIELVNKVGVLMPHYEVKIVPVSQEVADQRAGRGGRQFDSEGFGLMNAPRSAHRPPSRSPLAVYLHDDVVDAVLTSLALRVPLTPLNDLPGILKFIRSSRYSTGFSHPHDITGALLGLLYLSSGASWDAFIQDFLNAKYANNISDEFRVYSQMTKLFYPDLDVLLADHLALRPMLESGLFECVINNIAYPVAALAFIEGWLVPVGIDMTFVLGVAVGRSLPSNAVPVVYRGLTQKLWAELLNSLRLVGEIQLGTCNIIEPLPMADFTEGQVTPNTTMSVQHMTVINRIMELNLSGYTNVFVFYLAFYPSLIQTTYLNIVVNTRGGHHPLRATLTLNLAGIELTIGALMPMALLISCFMSDDQHLLAGVVPLALQSNRAIRTDRLLIWGPPDDITTIYASPLSSRPALGTIVQALASGALKGLFSQISMIVMDDIAHHAAWSALNPNVLLGTIDNSRLRIL